MKEDYKTSTEYLFGVLSLIVVSYRIIFVMYPIASNAIKEKNYSELFKSFTLLV